MEARNCDEWECQLMNRMKSNIYALKLVLTASFQFVSSAFSSQRPFAWNWTKSFTIIYSPCRYWRPKLKRRRTAPGTKRRRIRARSQAPGEIPAQNRKLRQCRRNGKALRPPPWIPRGSLSILRRISMPCSWSLIASISSPASAPSPSVGLQEWRCKRERQHSCLDFVVDVWGKDPIVKRKHLVL